MAFGYNFGLPSYGWRAGGAPAPTGKAVLLVGSDNPFQIELKPNVS